MASSSTNHRDPILKLRRRVGRRAVLTGTAYVLAVILWYFLSGQMVNWVTESDISSFVLRARDGADQIASNIARNLQDEVRRLGNLPEQLSDDVTLRAPLMSNAKPESTREAAMERELANERLRQVADLMEVDLAFILDEHGICIASSNAGQDRNVIGADLHQRAYFTAMENGGRGRQFAFGTMTAIAGVYFSTAIQKDGKFYGGVVVKRSMGSLFRLTTRNTAFLVDEYGVVVASNLERALWRYLPDSAVERLGSDFIKERYQRDTLLQVEIHPDQSDQPVSLIKLFDNPEPSLITARSIGDSGLRLIYFTPLPDLVAMRERARLTFWLLFLVGGLALTLAAMAFIYGLQNRQRVQALKHSNKKLAILSNALEKEKDTALAADRAKSRFLATISHELRTPFSGILGSVDLLRGCDLPEGAMQQVNLLERSAHNLLALLNNMLDFSKIDDGQLQVEAIPVDLAPVIQDVGAIQRAAAAVKGISLVITGADLPLVGICDPARLRQIFENFLSNAIKFTALGGVKMTVATEGVRDQRILRAIVQDSGPGIAPAAREQLFQPFFQADSSTTRKHGGTGLGLAISKRIAEAMGGQVGVETAPGHGATFWLEIPFRETELPPVNLVDDQNADPFARWRGKIAAKRILLVDDDEINRMVIGEMLQRVGHHISCAFDGRQAVNEVAANPFDLIVMDMHMPEMDGSEATRAIRRMGGEKATMPIIGLTADAIAENREQYLLAGLTELLTKPIGAADLLAAIQRHTEPGSAI
jgi:signal transduction histidine kinase/ActR/RegA family two-component response regulator